MRDLRQSGMDRFVPPECNPIRLSTPLRSNIIKTLSAGGLQPATEHEHTNVQCITEGIHVELSPPMVIATLSVLTLHLVEQQRQFDVAL